MKTYNITINNTKFEIDASKIEIAVRRGVEKWLYEKWNKKEEPTLELTAACVVSAAKHRRDKRAEILAHCKKNGHNFYSRNTCYSCKYVMPCHDCAGKSETMLTLPDDQRLALCKPCINKRYQSAGLPPPPFYY